MSKNIGAVIQARMNSTRLPGKSLLPLPIGNELKVIDFVYNRVNKSSSVHKTIIATSEEPTDDPLAEYCQSKGYNVFRGPLQHVFNRFLNTAEKYNLEYIVRITGDCPFIDPQIIDKTVESYFKENLDWCSSRFNTNLPRGLDCEVFSVQTMKDRVQIGLSDLDIEHVTPFLYDKNNQYKKGGIALVTKGQLLQARLTLDTRLDYIALCSIADYFQHNPYEFDTKDLFSLLTQKPWLIEINDSVKQKLLN